MLGVAWFAVALLVLQAGSDGLDWTRDYISQFANGPRGWLLTVGILGHAAGNVALGLGIYWSLGRGALRGWATALFLMAIVGLALTGLFTIEPPGAAPSAAGAIHRTASWASFALEVAALVLLSAAFSREARWRHAARLSGALAAFASAAAAVFLTAVVLDWRPGLAERAVLVPFMAWEFWAGAQLAFPQRR
jgi:hypothetical membrane protein